MDGRRPSLWAGLAALVVGGALVVGTPGVQAAPAAPVNLTGEFQLRVAHNGKCLDIYNASLGDAADAIQYACHGGANQHWQIQPVQGEYVTLVAAHSGKCMDVFNASTAENARAIQYTCHGGANQQWRLVPHPDGFVSIAARHSGKCLGVLGGSNADAARVVQGTCGAGYSQLWVPSPA